MYRRSILEEIGGFRKGYEGSQDYDLVLRFTEKRQKERTQTYSKKFFTIGDAANLNSSGSAPKVMLLKRG